MVRGLDCTAKPPYSDIRNAHRGTGSNLAYPHLLCRQLGKPHTPRLGGIPTVRKGDGVGGTRGRKKRTPSTNSRDMAATRQSYHPEKGANIRLVLTVRNLGQRP
jgi:hypothetical protein